jgi:phospholipid/cholesterol/gamma-HCH transport system substrate-binding protein
MENRAYAFAAGVFTLMLGAGLVFIAMWMTGETEKRDLFVLESRYPVTGLNPQAAVRFRGVDVGKVEAVDFDRKDPRLILINISVRTDTPITRGTYAQLQTQGVTGLAYVSLDDDGSKPERITTAEAQAVRIPMKQSFIDELSVAGKELVTDFKHVAARLNKLLSAENQEQLVRTLASLEAASARVTALARELEPGAKGVVALTDDARALLKRADEMMSGFASLATELKSLTRSFERVAASAENVGTATDTVARSAISNTLPRINRLLDQLSRTSQRLDRLLADLDEQPSSLVFGRPPPEPGPGEPGFTGPKAARP